MDFRDWYVVGIVSSVVAAASTFLFMHSDSGNFSTWCMFVGTLLTGCHVVFTYDDKHPDVR